MGPGKGVGGRVNSYGGSVVGQGSPLDHLPQRAGQIY